MLDALPQSATRRNLLDGGYTVLLLAVAVVTGYAVLSPAAPGATPVRRTVGAVLPPGTEPPTGVSSLPSITEPG